MLQGAHKWMTSHYIGCLGFVTECRAVRNLFGFTRLPDCRFPIGLAESFTGYKRIVLQFNNGSELHENLAGVGKCGLDLWRCKFVYITGCFTTVLLLGLGARGNGVNNSCIQLYCICTILCTYRTYPSLCQLSVNKDIFYITFKFVLFAYDIKYSAYLQVNVLKQNKGEWEK